MHRPPINIEERVDRIVGRRTPADPLTVSGEGRADAAAWQRAFGGTGIPRGVYRFHTHEEADAWLWQAMTRRRP